MLPNPLFFSLAMNINQMDNWKAYKMSLRSEKFRLGLGMQILTDLFFKGGQSDLMLWFTSHQDKNSQILLGVICLDSNRICGISGTPTTLDNV